MDEQQAELDSQPLPAASEVPAGEPEGSAPAEASGVPQPSRWNTFWQEWVRPLLIIALVMFSFRSAVADWNDVPTGSMKPTILEGDRIFINKVAYDLKFPFTMWRLAEWGDPVWGDIVVLRSPEDSKRLVKRVVGLPGDQVLVQNGRLYLNGKSAAYLQLDDNIARDIEAQLAIESRPTFELSNEKVEDREHHVMMTHRFSSGREPFRGPYEVPPDHFYVMGDNRSNSRDSRYFGAAHRSLILGRATAVALSVDPSRHYMPRWGRFFSALK